MDAIRRLSEPVVYPIPTEAYSVASWYPLRHGADRGLAQRQRV
jgi:hypothetical protein